MENKNNGGFSYTYSAREQEEIRKIRKNIQITRKKRIKWSGCAALTGRLPKKRRPFR